MFVIKWGWTLLCFLLVMLEIKYLQERKLDASKNNHND